MDENLEKAMQSLTMTNDRHKLHEAFKQSINCDITFGFTIKPFQQDMEIDENSNSNLMQEIPARIIVDTHKVILRNASPTFEKMLLNEWNVKGPIEIPQLTAAQFITFLDILYLDEVGEVTSTKEAFILYRFAVKYDCKTAIRLLTSSVVDNLFGVIDTKMFFPIYNESISTYANPVLEESCLEFVRKFTQNVIDSEAFLRASVETIEMIYKQDIMNIRNELSLVEALEKFIFVHEGRGIFDVKVKLGRAIGFIRFHILEEHQIKDTILLTDEEKLIFVSILKNEMSLDALPINFTRKTRIRYDANFVKYSSSDVFKLMTNFYRCDLNNSKCPSFTIKESDLPDLKPNRIADYYDIMRKLKTLHSRFNEKESDKIIGKILHNLFELQYCFVESVVESGEDAEVSGSSNEEMSLASGSSEEL